MDLIVALAPTIAVVISWLLQRRELKQIHVLVNSRLHEALQKIIDLERKLKP